MKSEPWSIYIIGATKMKKGYTLIEVLTTITIFSLIAGSVTGLFISSLMVQRRTLASQKLLDNVSYVLEYMGRALRMAKKDMNGDCLVGMSKYNYSTSTLGVTGIRFINYNTKCQEFYLDNYGRIYQRLSNNEFSAGLTGTDLPLTPSDFKVSTSTSKFLVFGASQTDQLQPKVTIFLDIETEAPRPEMRAKIKIQTTISQRDLDVEY